MRTLRLSSMGPVAAVTVFALAGAPGCNAQRKAECDRFTAAMEPLRAVPATGAASRPPTVETVDAVRAAIDAITFQDQPLQVYAKNYEATLLVLSNTLKLKASATDPDGPPSGTDGVIATNLKAARTDADDIARYCAP